MLLVVPVAVLGELAAELLPGDILLGAELLRREIVVTHAQIENADKHSGILR